MMNETKFTVVISSFEDCDTSVCRYNSLREMLQDLFFEGYKDPDDEWIDNPAEYRKDNPAEYRKKILKDINLIIDYRTEFCSFNVFYIKNNEIEELVLDEIDEDELITAYLTTYE